MWGGGMGKLNSDLSEKGGGNEMTKFG